MIEKIIESNKTWRSLSEKHGFSEFLIFRNQMLESVQCDFSSSLCQFFQRHMEIIAEPFGIHGQDAGGCVLCIKNVAFAV